MSRENWQWLVSALLAVGLIGVGVIMYQQSGQLSGISDSLGTLSSQLQILSQRQPVSVQPSAPVVIPSTPVVANDPISFLTTGLNVKVSKTYLPAKTGAPGDFKDEFTLTNLKGMVSECGNPVKSDNYYSTLIHNLQNGQSYQYSITYNGPSQDPTYKMYVLENTPGYTTLDQVKADLDVCSVGGIYPNAVNSKWIVFTASCGDAPDSTKPEAQCGNIQQVVDQTLKLGE